MRTKMGKKRKRSILGGLQLPFPVGKPKVNATAPLRCDGWGAHPSEGMASSFSQVLEWVKQTILAWLLY